MTTTTLIQTWKWSPQTETLTFGVTQQTLLSQQQHVFRVWFYSYMFTLIYSFIHGSPVLHRMITVALNYSTTPSLTVPFLWLITVGVCCLLCITASTNLFLPAYLFFLKIDMMLLPSEMLHYCSKRDKLWFPASEGLQATSCQEARSHYSLMIYCEVWNGHWWEGSEANRSWGPVSFEFRAAVMWKSSHYSRRFRNEERRHVPFWPGSSAFVVLCVSFNLVLSETPRGGLADIWCSLFGYLKYLQLYWTSPRP